MPDDTIQSSPRNGQFPGAKDGHTPDSRPNSAEPARTVDCPVPDWSCDQMCQYFVPAGAYIDYCTRHLKGDGISEQPASQEPPLIAIDGNFRLQRKVQQGGEYTQVEWALEGSVLEGSVYQGVDAKDQVEDAEMPELVDVSDSDNEE